MKIFQTTNNPAERVSAYLILTNEGGNSHVDELYRTTNYDHPTQIFLHDLETSIEKRVNDERKKREKSEQDAFCNKIKQFKF
jgi:hypothetical protein